jgi:hypothetical protein
MTFVTTFILLIIKSEVFMPDQVNFVSPNGELVIPVSSDDFLTGEILKPDYNSVSCWIVFYDVDGNAVTPTGGTISFKAKSFNGQWMESLSGDIAAVGVSTPIALYTPPSFSNGPVKECKLTLSGVVGAVSFSSFIWRY